MKSLLAFLLAIGSVSVVSCNTWDRMVREETTEETVTLTVTGMSNPVTSPQIVQSALRSVPGVESTDVDYSAKTVRVWCNENCDVDAMIAAIERAGFGATVSSESGYDRSDDARDDDARKDEHSQHGRSAER